MNEVNIDSYTKELEKRLKLDKGVITTGESIAQFERKIISVSPALDIGLSGGIPQGSWVLCSGKPKCGKSSLALHFAKHCIDNDMSVFYFDIEGRLKTMNLLGIENLPSDKITVIRSRQGNILDAEQNLTIAEDIIKNVPGALVIVDSSSALCSASEQIATITGQTRNQGPKLLASFCRKLGNVVPVNNSIVFIIQHLIANTSGYGSPFMEDGGNKIVYQGDVKIRSKGFSDWVDGTSILGQTIKWEVEFSALGPPGAKVESYLRYGMGIDELWEWSQIGIELGLIEAKGAWYNFQPIIGEDLKVNGQKNIWLKLKESPEILNMLKTKAKELL